MKYLTTSQASALLNVNQSRVRQLILGGKLPAIKHGRDWLINEADLSRVSNRKVGRPQKS